MSNAKPAKLGPFPLGVNNRVKDTDLKVRGGPGVPNGFFLRSGVNVELTDSGKMRRRHGYEQVIAGSGFHSLWSVPDGSYGFYVAGASLYRLNANLSQALIRNDMSPHRPVSYTMTPGGTVYYADGTRSGRATFTTDADQWGYAGDDLDPDSPDFYFTALPIGTIVRYSRGRLLSAYGRELCFSEPYRFDRYNPQRNVIRFPSAITLVVPVDGGVIVCADRTYWLGGDIATATLDDKLPYGGVAGSDAYYPGGDAAVWMSARGLCKVEGSTVTNLQEENVAVDPGEYGATYFRETDGEKKAVASMFNQKSSGMAAIAWMDAEIVRKGTVL